MVQLNNGLMNHIRGNGEHKLVINTVSRLALVPYDRQFLDRSWDWLNDPEIRALTLTPEFTREEQIQFFESLTTRPGYKIWGVCLGSELIGAVGLKNQRAEIAEYWGYIGERKYWGRGLGQEMMSAAEDRARTLGFSALDLKVGATNLRAISLYERMGFVVESVLSNEQVLFMIKREI